MAGGESSKPRQSSCQPAGSTNPVPMTRPNGQAALTAEACSTSFSSSLSDTRTPDFTRFTRPPSPCSMSSKPRVAAAHTARPGALPLAEAVLSSTQHLMAACGLQLRTPRRHLSSSRSMTKVAAGQPGMNPQVGSLQSPTAVMTFSRRGARAMSAIGCQTALGMPLPSSRNSSRSSRTES